MSERSKSRESRSRAARLAALLAVLGVVQPVLAAVELELDRTRITEGETVTLTFRTDDPRQKLDTDFSALEQDFVILDSGTETQLSIVNGRQTAVVRLRLTVEPRRSGEITIPALDFGGSRTRPVVLRVDPAPQLAPGELPPVFIEVEVVPSDGPYYVHAQLGLVVRVFYQQNLTEAAISQPDPSPASVRLLQETPYQADRGGERYRVLERRYAIFPERSGEMSLPAMQLSGRLVERRNSSIWQPSVRGRRVTVESEPLSLHIEPRPTGFAGDAWQPARDYSLSQQISGTDELRVGEPVTRTIIIDAVGLEENMIAEPAWPDVANVRIYPDQPQGITRDDGEWVLGHKEFRYAVVPEQEGELLLPELTVHWWDTENDMQRTASLPEQRVMVAPSALVPPRDAGTPAAATAPLLAPAGDGAEQPFWRSLALTFAALWLITLALAWRGLRLRKPRAAATERPARGGVVRESETLAELRGACKAGDARAARAALQTWLREFGPAGKSSMLEFASSEAGVALAAEIYALDATGFKADAANSWDGAPLRREFDDWLRTWRASLKEQRPAPTDLYALANRQAWDRSRP